MRKYNCIIDDSIENHFKFTNIKLIASGSEGSVYKIKRANRIYAMKISNIALSDIQKTLVSIFWREILFAKHMYSKYPLFFMKLVRYAILPCTDNYTLMNPENIYPKKLRIKYQRILDSGYCGIKIYNYIDYN